MAGRLLVGGDFAHSGSSSTYVTLGRLPDWEASSPECELTWSQPALPSVFAHPRYGAVERHGRRSGGLAGTFTPVPGSCEVAVSLHTCASVSGSVHLAGLIPEFAEAVLRGFQALSRSPLLARLGAGRLVIAPTWWHAIDSSASGFSALAADLVGVLSLPAEASSEDVWAIWRDQREALDLAPLLTWLAAALERTPRIGVFGRGAQASQVAALEAKIGVTLPDVLRETLQCVNGGRFEAPAIAEGHATAHRFALLSTEEIASTYFHLAVAQAEASSPERSCMVFQLPDGTRVPWPFVPIARDVGTGALLILEVLPAPYSNRVQLADSCVHWQDWPVLYRRYAEFLGDLLSMSSRTARRGVSEGRLSDAGRLI